MAAAPNLPLPEAATRTIVIDDTFTPTPQGIIVNPGDTVIFQNESGADLTIQFASYYTSTPVSSTLTVDNEDEVNFTAPDTDTAANYGFYVGGVLQPGGPWAIQVGSGPMYVVLSATLPVSYTPQTVAIPLGSTAAGMGTINIGPGLGSGSLTINFPTDPFTPPITAPGGNHEVAPGAGAGQYSYSAALVADNPGGGTVIIRST